MSINRRLVPLLAAITLLLPAAAAAHAPHPRDMGRIRHMAGSLEQAATRANGMADNQPQRRSRESAAALRALADLERGARHFHTRTRNWAHDPRQTEQSFSRLAEAWTRVARSAHHLRLGDRTRHELRAAEQLIYEIDRHYGYLGRHRPANQRWQDDSRRWRSDEAWSRDRDRDRGRAVRSRPHQH